MVRELIDSLPMWGILVTTIVLILAASEVGFMLGTRRTRAPDFEREHDQVNALTGAHLGLLAFIMAFSFSLAAEHAGKRKRLVLEEANAIQTAYMRAGMVGGEHGGRIQASLREYTALRADVDTVESIPVFMQESHALQERIWQQAKQLAAFDEVDELDALLIDSLNVVFEVHENRVNAGIRTRIPGIIWTSLYVLLVLSMVGMGYYSGIKGKRSPMANTALAVSFAIVLLLIADLDRPRDGVVKPDQTLMKELNQRLSAHGNSQ